MRAPAVALVLVLGPCRRVRGLSRSAPAFGVWRSSASVSVPVSTVPFNATDVQFATDMIPHHRQAVDMAALADTHASSAEVKALAAKIRKAQEPEIATMSGWLTAWGEPVPTPGAMHHDSATWAACRAC